MTENEKNSESAIFKDVWTFRKQFYTPSAEDNYWKAVIKEADRISQKHKSYFVDMLLLACFADLEAKHKVNNLGYPPKEMEEGMFDLWLKLTRS